MKKITAKYITENTGKMLYGGHVFYRGAEYWIAPDLRDDGTMDAANGTIYYISADRRISGCINGYEYGKVIDGVPYRI